MGRSTAAYSAYHDGGGVDDPASIASNKVLTESLTEYDDAGQVLMSTSKDRLHNATGNGSLNGPSGSQPKSRDSFSAMWYDEVGRGLASANYGTNAGTAPTRPVSAPTSSDTILVSQSEFDISGRAIKSIDAAGATVKSEFDDAGRTTKVINNFGGTDTQTIRTEYNSAGQMSKQIAENVDTGDQETVYVYGVTISSGSEMASNQLLSQMTHPDSGAVTYAYDRSSQQISMTDANGSVHDYSYDEAGRRIADTVSTLAAGVDGSVRRIEHGYDARMRLQNVTSYDAVTAGNVESDIQYEYNDFGQLEREYQQHGAAVSVSSSPVVEYDFEDGSSNSIRMKSLTYPDGRQLDYEYGASGSQTDRLDRVATVEDGATTLVTYQHSGAGSLVTQTYNEPGIEKTLHLGSSSDPYSALDRLGRMQDLRWTKGSTDLVRFEYSYDRVSNRLNERNLVAGTGGMNPAVDSLFEYDGLNRLTEFKTGELNTAGDMIAAASKTQMFDLDETGNFTDFTQIGMDPVTQSRTHNKVNEITEISETAGASWATPAHDSVGNMSEIPQPSDLTSSYDATWDAWHRLVKLEDGGNTVAVYGYDGTNRRIIKQVYSTGSLDETRHIFYTPQSQAIEERVDSSIDAKIQFVWNLGYVDDLVLRDRDTTANGTQNERLYSLHDLRYSVMALADATGAIVERFKYDAHGNAAVLTDKFDSRSSSAYDWEFRYTGRREDLETGLYFFRARYYHSNLGRFISRDPRGFVDGMSLYRGYFIPCGMDPSGQAKRGCFKKEYGRCMCLLNLLDCITKATACSAGCLVLEGAGLVWDVQECMDICIGDSFGVDDFIKGPGCACIAYARCQ